MRNVIRASEVLLFVLLNLFAWCQNDGIPPFGAGDDYKYDDVNLITLQPAINIPILAKAVPLGSGATFTAIQGCYGTYNTALWCRPATLGGQGNVLPKPLFGQLVLAKVGTISYVKEAVACSTT